MDEEGMMLEKLQDDMEMCDQFKDDLVPLALEYYLGVIEIEDEEGDEDDDDDDKMDKDDDSDDDGKKKKKKGKKGGDKNEVPLGPDGKPQECK